MTEQEAKIASEFNNTVLGNIKKLCIDHKTSIPKIEKALGYGNGSVSGWSKAKRKAPMDRIEAIAFYFSVDPSELTFKKKKPATKVGSGFTETDMSFIDDIKKLSPAQIEILRAAVQGFLQSRVSQDVQE